MVHLQGFADSCFGCLWLVSLFTDTHLWGDIALTTVQMQKVLIIKFVFQEKGFGGELVSILGGQALSSK